MFRSVMFRQTLIPRCVLPGVLAFLAGAATVPNVKGQQVKQQEQASSQISPPASTQSQNEDSSVQDQNTSRSDQPATQPNPVEKYLPRLDLPSLSDREAASQALLNDSSVTSKDIVACLKNQWASLSPEQRDRLFTAGAKKYHDRPGAIGIRFTDGVNQIINDIIANTPASRVLKPGDQIVGVNGTDLPADDIDMRRQYLQDLLEASHPGDTIHLEIIRVIKNVPQKLKVDVELVDPATLPGFGDFSVAMEKARMRSWSKLVGAMNSPQKDCTVDLLPSDLGLDPGNAPTKSADIVNLLQTRLGELSQKLAEISAVDMRTLPDDQRNKMEKKYLGLRDELSRIDARIRLLTSNANGRRLR